MTFESHSSMRFPMLSRACPGRVKCGPAMAQKRLRSCSDAPLFKSIAATARPVRPSVFFGLEIGSQWFTNPYKASRPLVPPPPSRPSSEASSSPSTPGLGGVRRSFMVVLTLETRVEIRVGHKIQVLENCVCGASTRPLARCRILLQVLTESNTSQNTALRKAVLPLAPFNLNRGSLDSPLGRDCKRDAGLYPSSAAKGHLLICRQMHMQHRRGAGLPYPTAP